MASKKNKEIVLAGRNIYLDSHNRSVYYRKSNKTGYIIKSEYAPEYSTLSKRYFLGILTMIVFYAFIPSFLTAIGFGVAATAILSWRFYGKFLPKLPQVKNFVPEKRLKRIEALASEETGRLLTLALLYIVLAVLIVLRLQEIEIDMVYSTITYILCVAILFYSGFHFYAIYYKKKHQ